MDIIWHSIKNRRTARAQKEIKKPKGIEEKYLGKSSVKMKMKGKMQGNLLDYMLLGNMGH